MRRLSLTKIQHTNFFDLLLSTTYLVVLIWLCNFWIEHMLIIYWWFRAKWNQREVSWWVCEFVSWWVIIPPRSHIMLTNISQCELHTHIIASIIIIGLRSKHLARHLVQDVLVERLRTPKYFKWFYWRKHNYAPP